MNSDEDFMQLALAQGMQGRVTAPPNPWVGCVIINPSDGLVGSGFHRAAGEPHAEALALSQAKERAAGSSVYVTLEPCSHYGRTPPCVNALIEAKVARVIIGVQDPDIRVKGKGIEMLQHAGIEVRTGVLADEVEESLAPYLHHRRTNRPYCLAKAAMSVDGRIAAADGTSKWISTAEARADAHQLRAESQAVLVGAGTAVADSPSLTVRDFITIRQPLRVVLDSSGRATATGPLFDRALAPTLVFTTSMCPRNVIASWEEAGAEVMIIACEENCVGVSLSDVFDILGKRGILQVMVEGGGILLGRLLQAHLINKLTIYIGPSILGDRGYPLFKNFPIASMDDSLNLVLVGSKELGQSIRLDYKFSTEKN